MSSMEDAFQSLVRGEAVIDLYQVLNGPSPPVNATMAFWTTVLTREVFYEQAWEFTPELARHEGQRGVDFSIRWSEDPSQYIALLFVDCTRFGASIAGAAHTEEGEKRLRDACIELLRDSNQTHIYGLSVIGTRARVWEMSNPFDFKRYTLWPLSGKFAWGSSECYLDAHKDAVQLIQGLFRIRNRTPQPMAPPATLGPEIWTWTYPDEVQQPYTNRASGPRAVSQPPYAPHPPIIPRHPENSRPIWRPDGVIDLTDEPS